MNCIQHPPVLERGESMSSSHIHDLVAHGKEHFLSKGLSEEIGKIVNRSDEGHHNRVVFHFLADEEMTAVYMLRSRMVLRVISQIAAGLVVHGERCRLVGT